MNKQEFIALLEKCKVPKVCHESWHIKLTHYENKFGKLSEKSLEIFVERVVEKGCCANAPW